MDFILELDDIERIPKALMPRIYEALGDQDIQIDREIVKGKSVKIGDRIIYPVVMLSTTVLNQKFTYDSITPFALAVVEPGDRYFISLEEKSERINKLLNEDLWDKIEL